MIRLLIIDILPGAAMFVVVQQASVQPLCSERKVPMTLHLSGLQSLGSVSIPDVILPCCFKNVLILSIR